jgi:deazaflavin-dependent oxidoreductase (nitroreductase family)
MTDDRSVSDHRDLRERIVLELFRVVNTLIGRMIRAGAPTGAPNVLLLVPGRRSGIERIMPVTMLDFEGHIYVQATYGASGWGRNLRAAAEVTMIQPGGRRSAVRPAEIPTDEAAAILRRAPYRRSLFLRRSARAYARPSAFYADTGCVSTRRRRIISTKRSVTRCSNSVPRDDPTQVVVITGPPMGPGEQSSTKMM